MDESDEDEEDEDEPVEYESKDFDVDYNVKRPPPIDTEIKCDGDQVVGTCAPNQVKKNYKPYEAYKGYSTWERRPLFVIIIGGLRWDYLKPDDTDYESQAYTQNPKLKAFNWIKRHGTTMKQVVPVFPPFDLPTWTSLATGLYPQNTGVVGDYMYNL